MALDNLSGAEGTSQEQILKTPLVDETHENLKQVVLQASLTSEELKATNTKYQELELDEPPQP